MEPKDTYRTVQNRSEGIFRDRGSKFLAFAYPVYSVEEIKQVLTRLRKEYHDARHHCYAYRLGASKEVFRVHDDGEPSGSAGYPILGQIRSKDLSNILIVVVRYFGGILLGVGGLIHAYRSAAASAIDNAVIVSAAEEDLIELAFPYPAINEVMRFLHEEGMKIQEQDFSESCRIRAQVRKSSTSHVLDYFSHRDDIAVRKI
jgi:uncharacterized YigZ family protein